MLMSVCAGIKSELETCLSDCGDAPPCHGLNMGMRPLGTPHNYTRRRGNTGSNLNQNNVVLNYSAVQKYVLGVAYPFKCSEILKSEKDNVRNEKRGHMLLYSNVNTPYQQPKSTPPTFYLIHQRAASEQLILLSIFFPFISSAIFVM